MILLDTNVLARAFQVGHIHHQAAINAIAFQRRNRQIIVVAPQILVEFYAIGTREKDGLAMTPEQTLAQLQKIKQEYPLLPESSAVFTEWEKLAAKHMPANRRVFDMRLVAFMIVHNIPQVLSFNDKDFSQFSEMQVLNPFDILNLPRV